MKNKKLAVTPTCAEIDWNKFLNEKPPDWCRFRTDGEETADTYKAFMESFFYTLKKLGTLRCSHAD